GRRGRGAVKGRGARGRGVAIGNGGVDTVSVNASGTTIVKGVNRGRGVVSEQQQTQARPKFNVSEKRSSCPHVIRKTNLFAGSQPGQSSQGPSQPTPSSQAPSQSAQSSQAHQGSSSQPQPMVTSPKRSRLKSPAKRIRP
ncbi:unnamed protein product, partial [Prunus brigantina]